MNRRLVGILIGIPLMLLSVISVLWLSRGVEAATARVGNTSSGSLTSTANANRLTGSRFRTGTTAGTMTSMSVRVGSIQAAPNRSYQVALYSDVDNKPGVLIAQSATGTLAGSTWNTISISARLEASTHYWLMYNTNATVSTRNNLRYSTNGTGGYVANSAFGTWPESVTAAFTPEAVNYSIYTTYTLDPTPPTVSLTAPADNAVLTGTKTVSASASGVDGVAGVQFQLNGANLGAEDTTSPYSMSWNTNTTPNGTYTLTAVARNSAGLTATSSRTVTVNNIPPVITVTSPAANQTVVGIQPITATVTDANGVAGVTFKVNDTTVGAEDTTKPYTVSWDSSTAPNGEATIRIIARDRAGSTAEQSMTVTVSNYPPSVTVTSPQDGSTIGGTQTLTADASDSAGVAGVQFKLNGVALGAEDTTAPYSFGWDTTTIANGAYTVAATVRNVSGLTTTASVQVTVFNEAVVTPGTWQYVPVPFSIDFDSPEFNYGSQTIVAAPSNPNIVYVGTNYQGIYKTTDAGATWTRLGLENSSGYAPCNQFDGRNWTLAVDPLDANIIYTVNGYGCYQGLWKSTDGGQTWFAALPHALFSQTTADIYSIAINPNDRNHILLGSHSLWNNQSSGVLESRDAGATWVIHPGVSSWGTGHYVSFLDGSDTWLLSTQGDGIWRTTNAGQTWSRVHNDPMPHGMSQTYKSAVTGWWYATTSRAIIRSQDNGATWTQVYLSPCPDGFGGIIGDGTRLYAAPANTGSAICNQVSYFTALETTDILWAPFNTQTFTNGPMNMTFDPINRIVYSSNWNAGVWKLHLSASE